MVCSNLIKIHWIYLLANFCVKSFAEDRFCTSRYMSNDGFNCSYCSAGSYREGQCVEENGSSICRPCPPGHFQPSCNIAESCQPCSDCKTSDFVEEKGCTPLKETDCRCPDGKYYQKETDKEGICLKHTSCKHGEVVKVKGTPYNDTVCVKTTTESPPNVKTSTHQTDATFQHTTSGHQIDTPSQTTEDGTCSCAAYAVVSAVGGIVVGVLATIIMRYRRNWYCFSRSCGRNARGAGNDIESERNPLWSRETSTTNGSDRAQEFQGNEASGGNTSSNANGRAQDTHGSEEMGGNTSSDAAQGSIDNGDPKIPSQESTSNGKFLPTGGKLPK